MRQIFYFGVVELKDFIFHPIPSKFSEVNNFYNTKNKKLPSQKKWRKKKMLSLPLDIFSLLPFSRGMADTLTRWHPVASITFSAEDSALWGPVFWGVTASAGFSESSGSAVAETAPCHELMFSVGLTFLLTSLSSGLSDSSLMGLSFLLGCIKKTALLFRKYKCFPFLLVNNHKIHISYLQTSRLNVIGRW